MIESDTIVLSCFHNNWKTKLKLKLYLLCSPNVNGDIKGTQLHTVKSLKSGGKLVKQNFEA